MPDAAAIYARISQDRTGAGLGVARQEADCRAWAEKHGWTVAEMYVDDDISAYKGRKRPAYERLLADLETRRRDGLVVWHPDRLHRSPRELEGFIEVVERTGVPIGTCTAGDVDLTTATGRMTARIIGAVARHESDHKAERIRRKHVELAQNGRVPGGGRRPFGYESDRVTIREDEADLIREAAGRVLAGEGLRTIAADWAERGVSSVTGARWESTTLKRLLRSGRIAGWREHHGQLVAKAEWPPIIGLEEHKRLRRLLDDPSRSNREGPTVRSYLLSGLLECGNCGKPLYAAPIRRKGIRYRRYRCIKERGGCATVGIGAEPLEALIVGAARIRLSSPAMAFALAAQQTRIDTGLEAAEARLTELAEMFAAGEMTRAEYSAARTVLMDRIETARKLEAAQVRTDQVGGDVEKFAIDGVWPEDLDRQRAILAAVLKGPITIAPTTRARNYFDPERVDLHWIDEPGPPITRPIGSTADH